MDNKPAGREIQVYQSQPVPAIPTTRPAPAFHPQRLRGFGAWARRWLRTSKPTEWMTSMAQILGVVAGIIASTILLRSGLFEVKNVDLQTKEAILKQNVAKLMEDQGNLERTRFQLNEQIVTARAEAASARADLLDAKSEAKNYKVEWIGLATAIKRIEDYSRPRRRLEYLKGLPFPLPAGQFQLSTENEIFAISNKIFLQSHLVRGDDASIKSKIEKFDNEQTALLIASYAGANGARFRLAKRDKNQPRLPLPSW